MSITKIAATRFDVVFIRKSTQAQDDQGQRDNVRAMLKELGLCVPAQCWFAGTVGRRKVKANSEFTRLMELVETDKVGTVYVESQDRWGTADRPELFSLLGTLRQHDTRLYDLRAKTDLTAKDLTTELLAFVGSVKSQKELEDISYRSLRTRVQNFTQTGSWPTGTHPYGYGKACYSLERKLLWAWQPVNRSIGQVFYPNADGSLSPGPENIKIPRKERGQLLFLVPSNNPDCLRAVKLVFDLYTQVGLSRRQISARLNKEGLRFNGGPFTHPDITNILKNPAYIGDTYFGKVQTGELHTFDAKGLVIEIKKRPEYKKRKITECLLKTGTHEGLVDRQTWELAQKKLSSERGRTSYAPRNPAYYLKQLLVCGHCGKGLTGRTESGKVVYVCSTYVAGRCNGHPVPCGYHRISHEDAERLLLDKIKEFNLEYDAVASQRARANLRTQLVRLRKSDGDLTEQYQRWFGDGVDALADYFIEVYGVEWPVLQRVRKLAFRFYCGDDLDDHSCTRLPVSLLDDFKNVLKQAEEKAVGDACRRIAELRTEHSAYTRQWVKATEEMQTVLKQDIDRLERAITEWEPRTVAVSQRLESLYQAQAELRAERKKLLREWPKLKHREKGESLRRLFNTVTLFWERKFHSELAKPSRPRKTTRPGRYSYALQADRIQWTLAATDLSSGSFR